MRRANERKHSEEGSGETMDVMQVPFAKLARGIGGREKMWGVWAICGANRGRQSEQGDGGDGGGEDTCNAGTGCEASKGKLRKGKYAGSAGNVWSKQGKAM